MSRYNDRQGHRGLCLFFTSSIADNMDFKIQRRGWQRECKKNNRFYKQNNSFARVSHFFWYISFLFLHDYEVKMPNFVFYGGRKQERRNFIFLSELGYGPLKFSFRRVRLVLTK